MESKIYPLYIEKTIKESFILDLGGGGEGIIGKLYGKAVLAIDTRKQELEETNNQALKVVMNAAEMAFLDHSFEVCTAFYTFMYMKKATRNKAIKEVYRVLRKGGNFYIWDTRLPSRDQVAEDIYVSHLEIHLQGYKEPIKTSYGIGLTEEGLDAEDLRDALASVGFKEIQVSKDREHFQIICKK